LCIIHGDTQFSFRPSLFYVSNWPKIWDTLFLTKRTCLVLGSTRILEFKCKLSSRFIIQFLPAAYFLIVLTKVNIASIDFSAILERRTPIVK
jgi:hypothetical protein